MANKHETLGSLFSDIADSIRAKTGSTGTIVADNFPEEIAAITGSIEAIIPKGRMRGDVDGDGKITNVDSGTILQDNVGIQDFVWDDISTWCADANGDGNKTAYDASLIMQYIEGIITRLPSMTDYYNNWTYDEAKNAWCTDISVDNIISTNDATVIVDGSHDFDFFQSAQCLDGAIRIYAKACPIADLSAKIVIERNGTGAAIIVVEDSIPENLDPELAEQDELITQLASALEGKVGASGAPEPISITADNIEQYFIVEPFAGDVAFDWSNNQFSAQDVDGAILIISFTALQNVDLSLRLTISPEVVGGELFITHNNNNVFNAPNPMATAELSCDASFNFNLSANDVLLIDTVPVGSVVISNLSVIPK